MATLLGILAEQGYSMSGKPIVTKTDESAIMAASMLQELAIMFELQTDNIIMFTSVYNSLRNKGTVQFPNIDKSKITRISYQPPVSSNPVMLVPPPGMNVPYPSPPQGIASYPYYAPQPSYYPQPSVSQPMSQHPPQHSHQHHPQQERLSLENQLALVDSVFDKLRHDLSTVTNTIRSVANKLINGTYCTLNTTVLSNNQRPVIFSEEFLDEIDMLQQIPVRLAKLIEIGIAGILDEHVFEQCLQINDSVSRLLEISVPLIEYKESSVVTNNTQADILQLNPEATLSIGPTVRKFSTIQDLCTFGLPTASSSSSSAVTNNNNDTLLASPSKAEVNTDANNNKNNTKQNINTHNELTSLFNTSPASSIALPGTTTTTTIVHDDLFDIQPSVSSTTTNPKMSFAPVNVSQTNHSSTDDFASLIPSSSTLTDNDFGTTTSNPSSNNVAASKPNATSTTTTNTTNMPSSTDVLADLDALLQP